MAAIQQKGGLFKHQSFSGRVFAGLFADVKQHSSCLLCSGLLLRLAHQAVKKAMPGFMTGRGHESIFRGIEVKPNINPVEASRQLQLQQTFMPRRKHDFDEGNLPDD